MAARAAIAHNCPNEMRAIDASQATEVKKLHKEGKHGEPMAALGKAKGILRIK